jgi:hypothetical protein
MVTPIALFTYNRRWHAEQTVQALQRNALSGESDLIVFSDGPKSDEEGTKVLSLRRYLKTIQGFRSVSIVEREDNLGLARSIIAGVSEIVNSRGRVIVLEDDLVSSPYFLKFMNEALEYYRDEERVISIHGYVYPINSPLPETFFLKGADCWGWATWKRGWDLFEPDGKKLLEGIRERKLRREFDFNGAYPYTRMLEDQIREKNDSWAIRWYASAFLQGKLTLYPGKSLIKNIGTDKSGTHSGETSLYDTEVTPAHIPVSGIPIEENTGARKEIERYLRGVHPGFAARIRKRIVRLFR